MNFPLIQIASSVRVEYHKGGTAAFHSSHISFQYKTNAVLHPLPCCCFSIGGGCIAGVKGAVSDPLPCCCLSIGGGSAGGGKGGGETSHATGSTGENMSTSISRSIIEATQDLILRCAMLNTHKLGLIMSHEPNQTCKMESVHHDMYRSLMVLRGL